jgi:hypothetical protein
MPVLMGGVEARTPRSPRPKTDVQISRELRVTVRVAVDPLVRRSVVAEVAVVIAIADARAQLERPDSGVDDLVREADYAPAVPAGLNEDLRRHPRDEIGK